jgi:hypothetical protein
MFYELGNMSIWGSSRITFFMASRMRKNKRSKSNLLNVIKYIPVAPPIAAAIR